MEQRIVVRAEHQFHSDTYSESVLEEKFVLDANHTYEITVGLRDRDTLAATIRGEVSILLNNTMIASRNLYDHDQGGEDYEPSAWDSLRINILTNGSVNLTIAGEMELGDYWSIEMFQDLPDFDFPELGFVLMVSGYASIISGTWLACVVLRIATKMVYNSDSNDEQKEEKEELGVVYYD